jgi:hypothetical protein
VRPEGPYLAPYQRPNHVGQQEAEFEGFKGQSMGSERIVSEYRERLDQSISP